MNMKYTVNQNQIGLVQILKDLNMNKIKHNQCALQDLGKRRR